tara:strand:- start:952 stop:1056 length:105 start_codon:yes stop_codon:yes gene_type:complete
MGTLRGKYKVKEQNISKLQVYLEKIKSVKTVKIK